MKKLRKMPEDYPNRIFELRSALGLSLQAIADQIGTSAEQIRRLQDGERQLTLNWMKRLSPVFDVAAEELLIAADRKPNPIALLAVQTSSDQESPSESEIGIMLLAIEAAEAKSVYLDKIHDKDLRRWIFASLVAYANNRLLQANTRGDLPEVLRKQLPRILEDAIKSWTS